MHEREAAPQAPHEKAAGQAPVEAAAPSLGSLGPAGVLALQRAAGNASVTGLLQRDDAPATAQPQQQPAQQAPPPPPPTGPATPGRTANLGAPPKKEGVQPGVDLAADTQNVTVSVVLRGLDLATIGSLDIGHEPSLSFVPSQLPQPVIQAAIAALNLHLRNHGNELVELSASPQVGIGGSGPQAGVQAQAEIHVTTSLSLTVSSSVTVQPRSDEPDPGNLRIGRAGPVDINWSPVTAGVLWHFGQGAQPPPRDQRPDEAAERRSAAFIDWVRAQLDPADFDNGQPPDTNTRGSMYDFVRQLFEAMRSASGRDVADVQFQFGLTRVPERIMHGLTTAATLIARGDPSLSSLRLVRASIVTEDASGQRHVRWIPLPLR